MTRLDVDVVVLGSGFAGSLMAMILRRIGRSVVLIDKAKHPRFAIGESSTPIANMILRDLALRYDLPRLLPLCKYGTWQRTYPELMCGLKRGFSYFAHERGQPFSPSSAHHNELLVAASNDDEHSDTHWLRADLDTFLCREATTVGVEVLEETDVSLLKNEGVGRWRIECKQVAASVVVQTRFVIDATGEAGALPRSFGIASDASRFRTRSRAVFSHFADVRDWQDLLSDVGGSTEDYPFPCDHAAQHHLLDEAWVWMLRFQRRGQSLSDEDREIGGTGSDTAHSESDRHDVSLGIVLHEGKHPFDDKTTAEEEWSSWLTRYPSLAEMVQGARLAETPGKLIRTRRLQRCWQQFAGHDWALLPHTAGFIDPLHSTGIAHSLCGIERLAAEFEKRDQTDALTVGLRNYEATLHAEFDLIDELVSCCFSGLGYFDVFAASSMLYFAAATTYEHLRAEGAGADSLAFLCADREDFRAAVRRIRQLQHTVTATHNAQASRRFVDGVAEIIAPFNRVGLCDGSANNMYRYTIAPD